MATITTAQDWRNAATQWVQDNQGGITGVPTIISNGDGTGKIVDGNNADITPDNPALEAALDAYNTAVSTQDAIEAVEDGAKSQASGIPNWASWDEATALNWHDTNIANALPVANLTEANALLEKMENENRALVRLVLALRNKIWPDLQS